MCVGSAPCVIRVVDVAVRVVGLSIRVIPVVIVRCCARIPRMIGVGIVAFAIVGCSRRYHYCLIALQCGIHVIVTVVD